jgi:hypothetical protein
LDIVYRKRIRGYLSYNEVMAVKLTPAGVIGKWVIVPILVLLIGYFVVGPNVGKTIAKTARSARIAKDEPPNADPAPTEGHHAASTSTSGPDVDVRVHRAKNADSTTAG